MTYKSQRWYWYFRVTALVAFSALLSACANKISSLKPLSYYSSPTSGPTATIIGERHNKNSIFSADRAVFVQSLFADQIANAESVLANPILIPTGEVTVGIGYADWERVGGTVVFFKAELGGQYQIHLGSRTRGENANDKFLSKPQQFVWVENLKTKKAMTDEINIHPSIPDQNTPPIIRVLRKSS